MIPDKNMSGVLVKVDGTTGNIIQTVYFPATGRTPVAPGLISMTMAPL